MHFLLIILKMFFDLLSMTVALQSSGKIYVCLTNNWKRLQKGQNE